MRFQVGEMAKFTVATVPEWFPRIGTECVVVKAGAIQARDGSTRDYVIRFADGAAPAAFDWQLQKLSPPDEPIEMIRHLETAQ